MVEDKTIGIIATLDTKGKEVEYVSGIIKKNGFNTQIIDTGIMGTPGTKPDITREHVAYGAGYSINELIRIADRSISNPAMAEGASNIIIKKISHDSIHGIISLGGSQGTSISTKIMQKVPIGFPKIMVSTMASGDVRPYVDIQDITMMHSVVDISGLNCVLKTILANAAGAICGMVKNHIPIQKNSKKRTIAMSMYGSTTPCVTKAAKILNDTGFETMIFHASGPGGKAMERMIMEGNIDGILDITLGEISNEYLGGIQASGGSRMTSAAKMDIPQVTVPGGACTSVFGEISNIPEKYRKRKLIQHTPKISLIRANLEESKNIGKIIGEKLNMHPSKNYFMIPRKSFCFYYQSGNKFFDPESDIQLIQAVKESITNKTMIEEYDLDINTSKFAEIISHRMIQLMEEHYRL